MAACRVAILLMNEGFQDIRILDGSLQKWKEQGFIIIQQNNLNKYLNLKEYYYNLQQKNKKNINMNYKKQSNNISMYKNIDKNIFDNQYKNKLFSSVQEVKLNLKQQNVNNFSLVSVRSLKEFQGQCTGYDYMDKTGDIEGAKWGHAGVDINNMDDYRNLDQTMIQQEIILKQWQQNNINKDQNVIFYCGTGWRASEALFYAYLLGWQKISLYDGGWYEWSQTQIN